MENIKNIRKGRPLLIGNKRNKYNLLYRNILNDTFQTVGAFDGIETIHQYLTSKDFNISDLTLQNLYRQEATSDILRIVSI